MCSGTLTSCAFLVCFCHWKTTTLWHDIDREGTAMGEPKSYNVGSSCLVCLISPGRKQHTSVHTWMCTHVCKYMHTYTHTRTRTHTHTRRSCDAVGTAYARQTCPIICMAIGHLTILSIHFNFNIIVHLFEVIVKWLSLVQSSEIVVT